MPDLLLSHGDIVVIAVMTIVTYACRISGVIIMQVVPVTPRVERALKALPGSIIAASIVPIAMKAGPGAVAALGVAMAMMAWRRNDLLALATGLAFIIAWRAAGL